MTEYFVKKDSLQILQTNFVSESHIVHFLKFVD